MISPRLPALLCCALVCSSYVQGRTVLQSSDSLEQELQNLAGQSPNISQQLGASSPDATSSTPSQGNILQTVLFPSPPPPLASAFIQQVLAGVPVASVLQTTTGQYLEESAAANATALGALEGAVGSLLSNNAGDSNDTGSTATDFATLVRQLFADNSTSSADQGSQYASSTPEQQNQSQSATLQEEFSTFVNDLNSLVGGNTGNNVETNLAQLLAILQARTGSSATAADVNEGISILQTLLNVYGASGQATS